MSTQNYINHIDLVLDASTSMRKHADNLVKVADEQVQYLAQRSKDLDQETRVTVYTFGGAHDFNCLFFDKDVLRLPSLRGLYSAQYGATALVDATIRAISELRQTSQLYGDHAFLTYLLTDGEDNDSNKRSQLRPMLETLKDNETVACFVPNQVGVHEAKGFGFPAGNIAVWDTSTDRGIFEGGKVMRAATDTFMAARATGVRSHRGLFQMDTTGITPAVIQRSNLQALHPGQYRMVPVDFESPIADFYERTFHIPYVKGVAYYQINKSEIVQGYKPVAIFDKSSHQLYVGAEARRLAGLPDYEVRVSPSFNPKYDIFVQSTSVNRKLIPGTRLLVLS